MTEQEIREGAPSGATCYGYSENADLYYFNDNYEYWNELYGVWMPTSLDYRQTKPL